jgi:hypothetical protein
LIKGIKINFTGNLKLKNIKKNDKILDDEQNKLIKFIKILNNIDNYNNFEEDCKEIIKN